MFRLFGGLLMCCLEWVLRPIRLGLVWAFFLGILVASYFAEQNHED